MSITDLNLVEQDPFAGKKYDICICGAGPAGITLARKLSSNFSVCLLEAGGMEFSRQSQNFYIGTNTGTSYFGLEHCRLRYFGGASGHWGGSCRILDPEDFIEGFENDSDWPINHHDLAPYIAETRSILDVKPCSNDIQLDTEKQWLPPLLGHEETQFWLSKPTQFGPKYADEIRTNERIDCFVNANVTDIILSDGLDSTTGFEVSNYLKTRFRVHAKKFIVASGGLENPRILLNANKQIKAGVANQNDLVGRFFADHPHHHLGEFILEDDAREKARGDTIFLQGQEGMELIRGRFFKPTTEHQMAQRKLNYSVGFRPAAIKPQPDESSFKSRLRDIVCTSNTLRASAEWIKSGSVTCFGAADGYLKIQAEQELNPDTRITQSSQVDEFGNYRLNLHWQFTDLDRKTIKEAAFQVAREFAQHNVGRVRLENWLLEDNICLPGVGEGTPSIVAGPHHMCTTRMADTAEKGVVDKHQKVFGNQNLYIAGSSVFSTAGFSNPTFTIVQMSLRLANHLKGLPV